MGKVTALYMDCITKKSGHSMTGMAVSVCITPAAPSPLPIPYPTMGTVAEGITDPCMRTKISNAIVLTVGGNMAKCHGNEPGTMKEVVSLNTTGPCFPWLGAPIVWIELGMAGITGSMGQMNKQPVPGVGGSASGAGGGAGGAGAGGAGGGGPPGANAGGPNNGGGGGGGSSSGAASPNAPASPSAEGQAAAGHPVDVATGTLFTQPVTDFWLTGFLSYQHRRSYATSAVDRDVGLGRGWSHTLDVSAVKAGDGLELVLPRNERISIPDPVEGTFFVLPFGRRVTRLGLEIRVSDVDGFVFVLHPVDDVDRFVERRTRRYLVRSVVDTRGNAIVVEWERGAPRRIGDSVGRIATFTREEDTAWWDVVAFGPDGERYEKRAVTYLFDAASCLREVIDAGGAVTRYAYDGDGYMTEEHLADGLVYHFVHELSAGTKRCVETWGQIDGGDVLRDLGGEPSRAKGVYHARLEFRPEQRTTVVIDAVGGRHTYVTNDFGLVDVYIDPRGYSSSYGYDRLGNLVTVRDGGGRSERRTFDTAGRQTRYVDGEGHAFDAVHDEAGSTISVRGPVGAATRITYAGDRVVAVDESDRAFRYTWSDRGRLVAAETPGAPKRELTYDAHGNVSEIRGADGSVTRYVFDAFGCPVEIVTPTGDRTSFAYDSRFDLVRLTEEADGGAPGNVTEYEIDAMRNVVAIRDVKGTTRFRYVAGKLVERTGADGRIFRMGYDALCRLAWMVNPAGERMERRLDGAGNLVFEKTFAGLTFEREYDGSNVCVRTQKRDGSWTRYDWDRRGRIREVEHSTGLRERFVFDERRLLVAADNQTTSTRIVRDEVGRASEETQETGGYRFRVSRSFDAAGRVTHVGYGTSWDVEAAHDDARGTSRLTLGGKVPEQIVETRDALRTTRTLSGGAAIVRTRGARGRLERVDLRDPLGGVVGSRRWSWGSTGAVDSVVDDRHGTRAYQLDVEDRPLRVSGLGTDARFAVAPQGNVVPADGSFRLGAGGRPLSVPGAELAWDELGRLAKKTTASAERSFELAYDGRDRLVGATRGDGRTIRYAYDALGRCVARFEGDGRSTYFGWDADRIVEENGADGRVVRRVFEADGFTPVAETDASGAWRLVAVDAAATPFALLDGGGEVRDVELDAWGHVVRGDADATRLRFAGQLHDPCTGLHYNRNRFYDPDLHVFVTPDPLGPGVSIQDVSFVPNVTIYVDPSGFTTIVYGSPDPGIEPHRQGWLARYPGARVIYANDLKPGDLANEDHVIVQTHGEPGRVEFGAGNMANGQQVGDALSKAGFKGGKGSKIDVSACNSATPAKGGTSFARDLAENTQSETWGAKSNHPEQTYNFQTAAGAPANPQSYNTADWSPGWMYADAKGNPFVAGGSYVPITPRREPTTPGMSEYMDALRAGGWTPPND